MGAPEPRTSPCHLIQSPQEAWAIGAHFSNEDTEVDRSAQVSRPLHCEPQHHSAS